MMLACELSTSKDCRAMAGGHAGGTVSHRVRRCRVGVHRQTANAARDKDTHIYDRSSFVGKVLSDIKLLVNFSVASTCSSPPSTFRREYHEKRKVPWVESSQVDGRHDQLQGTKPRLLLVLRVQSTWWCSLRNSLCLKIIYIQGRLMLSPVLG